MWGKISLSVLHYIQGPMKNKWNILLVLAEHWSRTCTTWLAFNLTAQMSRLGDAQLATPVSFMLHNHSLIHSCVVTSWVVTSNLIHACVQHGPLMWPFSLSLCWYAHAHVHCHSSLHHSNLLFMYYIWLVLLTKIYVFNRGISYLAESSLLPGFSNLIVKPIVIKRQFLDVNVKMG